MERKREERGGKRKGGGDGHKRVEIILSKRNVFCSREKNMSGEKKGEREDEGRAGGRQSSKRTSERDMWLRGKTRFIFPERGELGQAPEREREREMEREMEPCIIARG